MKKIIALMLVMAISLSLFGCELIKGKEDPVEETPTVNTPETPENNDPTDEEKYQNALALIKSGKCKEAYDILKALGDYKDAKTLLTKFRIMPVYMKDVSGEIIDNQVEIDSFGISETVIGANGFPAKISMLYEDDSTDIYDVTYDEKGRPVLITNYYDGDVCTEDFIYDANNNLLQSIYTRPDGDKVIYTYTYDTNGNRTTKSVDWGNGLVDTTRYEYDSANRNTLQETLWGSGTREWYAVEYDSNGNITKETYGYGEGSTSYEYEYDDKGVLIGKTTFHDDVQYSSAIYYYNTDGKLTRRVEETVDDLIVTDTYVYDAKGNLTEKAQLRAYENGDKVLETKHEYTYNDKGLVLTDSCVVTYYSTPDRSYNYVTEYGYDADGNVTRECTVYGDGDYSLYEWQYALVFMGDDITEDIFELISELVLYL